MKNELLTLPEFALKTGVKQGTLRKQLNRDLLLEKKYRRFPGARKVGRDWFIPAKESRIGKDD